jgi:hypothetical protein
MRKISVGQVLAFLAIMSITLSLAGGTAALISRWIPSNDFRGILVLFVTLGLVYVYALLFYRIWLKLMPLPTGVIPERSRAEFSYHVYLLFFLILFYPLMRSGVIPIPLLRLIYLALGARLGSNTYSSGIILDPIFVTTGDNCIVGQFALLIPHVIEGRSLAHYPIVLGNQVTIGAHAVVLSGTIIGDHAIVASGAIVSKGTKIPAGEIWGGVPARRLGETGALQVTDRVASS